MRREAIFDLEVDILPHKFIGAHFLRDIMATEATTDLRGLGTLTTVDNIQAITFPCQWEPYVTNDGLIIVYYQFPNESSYLIQAIDDFLDRIQVV